MKLEDVQAELEEDLAWRLDEIRFLRNRLADLPQEDQRAVFRRSMIVMLYAHFEGFCQFALLHYVRNVNASALTCENVVPVVLAASWHDVFAGLDVPEQRKVFRADLPDDPKLAKLSRRSEFARRIRELLGSPVSVPDSVVDTESNLSATVLRKNLFRIGLDLSLADQWEHSIGQLLGRRNNIAHGEDREGVNERQYAEVEVAALKVMSGVLEMVMESLRRESFRHTPTPTSQPAA